MTEQSGFPMGSVVAYAGILQGGVEQGGGWYLCDGSGLDSNSFGSFYNVITNRYGSSNDTFYLPDYQGQFLRGVDGGTGRDPDASSRMQPRTGLDYNGATGSSCGSRQASAMAGDHYHTYSVRNSYDSSYGRRQALSGTVVVQKWSPAARSSSAQGGAELRPTNQYVNFMIQSQDLSPSDSLRPGIVVAYAGDCSSSDARTALEGQGWLLCDGRSEETGNPDYSGLYTVISTTYGSQDPSTFCIPRYFGRFLRGVDSAGNTDPDHSSRQPPRPDLTGQGSAAGVGSIQGQLYPSHTHQYDVSDNSDENNHGSLNNPLVVFATSSATTDSNCNLGNESRPKNIALEYLIFYPGTASVGMDIPSGTVIAYAGDANSANAQFDPSDPSFCGWMVCNGDSYSKDTQSNLFSAIGYAHGGSGSSFNVPDLQGRFIRGVDHSSDYGLDQAVDPGPRQAAADGGNESKVGSFQDDALQSHSHDYLRQTNTSELKQGNDGRVKGNSTSSLNMGTPVLQASATSTGTTLSSENRPANMYVYYLIKA